MKLKISPAVRVVTLVWLGGRVLLSAWGLLIYLLGLVPDPSLHAHHYWGVAPITDGVIGIWQRWDTVQYQRIILDGYLSHVELSAFFPLYPLLGRALSQITGIGSLAALLLVGNLAYFLALIAIFTWVDQDHGPIMARRAVFAAVLFPTSFFFYAGYPIALALLFTILAYLFARRGRWLLTALAGVLAGLSHSTVIPLAAMLLYEAYLYWRQNRSWRTVLILPAAISPLMGVAIFLSWRAGQALPPLSEMMSSGWQRVVQTPWRTLLDIPIQFRNGPIFGSLYSDLLLLVVMLAACFWGLRRLRASEWIYQITLTVFLLVTTIQGQPLASFGRYMLMSFPVYLLTAKLVHNKALKLAGFALGLSLQLFLSAIFFAWGWVD